MLVGEGGVQEQLHTDVRDRASSATRYAAIAQEARSLTRKFQKGLRAVKCIVGLVMKRQAGSQRVESRKRRPRPQHGREIRQHGAEHELCADRPASGLVALRDQCVTEKIHGKGTD